jgi:protein tyrosine/serine phosphatase
VALFHIQVLTAAVVLVATGCARTVPNNPPVLTPLTQAQAPRNGYVVGVENFGFVTDELWRGARPTSTGYQTLTAMGVKTIIDLQEVGCSKQISPGVEYRPVRTSKWNVSAIDLDRVLDVIKNSPKPVFIHCEYGCDRTGLAVAAYRVQHGFSADEAIRELDNFHVHFWFRDAIVKRIKSLPKTNPSPASQNNQ